MSHDRAFLDNVVTQTLAAEGDGRWKEYVGGYSDWVAQRPTPATVPREPAAVARAEVPRSVRAAAKLSYKEQRELDALPAELEALEAEQAALTARMNGADYHQETGETMRRDAERAGAVEHELATKLERWVELEARAGR